jgi:phage gp46-like protein
MNDVLHAELKSLQKEVVGLRGLLKQVLKKIDADADEAGQWVDKDKALQELGITERQLSHRAKLEPSIKRKEPGVGVQVHVARYKRRFNS